VSVQLADHTLGLVSGGGFQTVTGQNIFHRWRSRGGLEQVSAKAWPLLSQSAANSANDRGFMALPVI